eukprot:snap_masked-scaffold_22-processed-gene-0.36-mRNA-1 protein AED:1.00 eAED:1.00 QI:0/-1/0/0/-1/1/1/0/202
MLRWLQDDNEACDSTLSTIFGILAALFFTSTLFLFYVVWKLTSFIVHERELVEEHLGNKGDPDGANHTTMKRMKLLRQLVPSAMSTSAAQTNSFPKSSIVQANQGIVRVSRSNYGTRSAAVSSALPSASDPLALGRKAPRNDGSTFLPDSEHQTSFSFKGKKKQGLAEAERLRSQYKTEAQSSSRSQFTWAPTDFNPTTTRE